MTTKSKHIAGTPAKAEPSPQVPEAIYAPVAEALQGFAQNDRPAYLPTPDRAVLHAMNAVQYASPSVSVKDLRQKVAGDLAAYGFPENPFKGKRGTWEYTVKAQRDHGKWLAAKQKEETTAETAVSVEEKTPQVIAAASRAARHAARPRTGRDPIHDSLSPQDYAAIERLMAEYKDFCAHIEQPIADGLLATQQSRQDLETLYRAYGGANGAQHRLTVFKLEWDEHPKRRPDWQSVLDTAAQKLQGPTPAQCR